LGVVRARTPSGFKARATSARILGAQEWRCGKTFAHRRIAFCR
jgi:hypothetical protein